MQNHLLLVYNGKSEGDKITRGQEQQKKGRVSTNKWGEGKKRREMRMKRDIQRILLRKKKRRGWCDGGGLLNASSIGTLGRVQEPSKAQYACTKRGPIWQSRCALIGLRLKSTLELLLLCLGLGLLCETTGR